MSKLSQFCLAGDTVLDFDRTVFGHEACRESWCSCSCHGDEPPAGVREPRTPDPRRPVFSVELAADE